MLLDRFPSATLKETKQAPEVTSEHYIVTETPYSLLALVYHGWYHCHTPKEYPNNSTLICNPETRTIARMTPEHLVIHHCETVKMFWTILMFYVRFDVLEEILLDHINPQIEIEPLEPQFFNLLYNPKGQSMVHSFTGTEINLNAILRHLDYRPGTLTVFWTEQEGI